MIYRNTQSGIRVTGKSDVRIIGNTLYAATGDNIRIDGNSSLVEVRNNILWAESGCDLYVANDSQTGFFSDYNTLYAGENGTLVYWTKDFRDVLDWQADVAAFDFHSVGRTLVNPEWAEPRFLNLAKDDFRIFAQAAGQRFTSPTVNAADPLTDQGLPSSYRNLLVNADFDSNLLGWNTSAGASTRTTSPAPFTGAGYFFGGNIGAAFAEQTVDLIAAGYTADQLDSNALRVAFGGRIRSSASATPDTGQIHMVFLSGSGATLKEVVSPAANTSDRWELLGEHMVVPTGTRSILYRFEAVNRNGGANDSYLDHAFLYLVHATSS
jgi:hypothetical protein